MVTMGTNTTRILELSLHTFAKPQSSNRLNGSQSGDSLADDTCLNSIKHLPNLLWIAERDTLPQVNFQAAHANQRIQNLCCITLRSSSFYVV